MFDPRDAAIKQRQLMHWLAALTMHSQHAEAGEQVYRKARHVVQLALLGVSPE